MKKTIIAAAIAMGIGALISAPAQAIDCHAFNQGTFHAAHINGVTSPGILRIASACHPG